MTNLQSSVSWLLSPAVSSTVLQEFAAIEDPNWLPGLYFLPKGQRAAIVAINRLPVTPETLWLRILGRDRVQPFFCTISRCG